MKEYSVNKRAKMMTITLIIIPIGLLGLLQILGLIAGLFHLDIFSKEFMWGFLWSLFWAYLIIKLGIYFIYLNNRKIIIDGDKLIFKGPIVKDKVYSLPHLKEIVEVSFEKAKGPPIMWATPEGLGRVIARAVTTRTLPANRSPDKLQFAAKDEKGKIFFIRSNFIDDALDLHREIEKRSGLPLQRINLDEFKAWKKGELASYRRNPKRKLKQFLEAIGPYFNIKTALLLPMGLFSAVVLALNIWFNWQHYQFLQLKSTPNPDTYSIIVKNDKYGYKDTVDFFVPGKSQAVLSDVLVFDSYCRNKSENKKYRYYFFPFQQPYCFSHFVNLDKDNDTEIIYRLSEDKYPYHYGVYDFDHSKQMFIAKPISSYSKSLDRYVQQVRLDTEDTWIDWIRRYIWFFVLFFALMVVLLLIKRSLKKESLK